MKKIRIMIVEDEYLVLMGIKTMVEELGHIVVGEAKDGPEAVSLALQIAPDLILLDINLPKMHGIEVVKKLREKADIPVIMITGYSDRDYIERANSQGVLGYLVKPVSKKDLGPALEIAMSRFEDMERLKKQVAESKTELENRKMIEKAKGIIMKKNQLDEEAAFRWLQSESRNRNVKLAKLAESIVEKSR